MCFVFLRGCCSCDCCYGVTAAVTVIAMRELTIRPKPALSFALMMGGLAAVNRDARPVRVIGLRRVQRLVRNGLISACRAVMLLIVSRLYYSILYSQLKV